MKEKNHACEDNLDSNCKCKLCGKLCHAWADNDDGSFAASGKIVTARCVRCGMTERYHADTGTTID